MDIDDTPRGFSYAAAYLWTYLNCRPHEVCHLYDNSHHAQRRSGFYCAFYELHR